MRQKRVLHYVDENRLSWMLPWIQLLKELERLGIENHVLCRSGGTLCAALRANDIKCLTYNPLAQWFPFMSRGIGRALKVVRPDLIHTRLSSAAALGGWWGKHRNVPVVSTFDKFAKRRYYRHSNVLIGCSSAVTAHIKTLDLPCACFIGTILNPIEAGYYTRDESVRKATRAVENVAAEEIVVMGMGRFVGWKGWDTYLKAIALIPENERFRFYLFGCGEEEKKLKQLAERLDIVHRVKFKPFVSDVRPWLWAADVFVFPSHADEAFGLMLLEAMACKTVPIATDIPGTRDIAFEDRNALIFGVGDAVALSEAILRCTDVRLRARLAAEAVRTAERISVSEIARQTRDLYECIVPVMCRE